MMIQELRFFRGNILLDPFGNGILLLGWLLNLHFSSTGTSVLLCKQKIIISHSMQALQRMKKKEIEKQDKTSKQFYAMHKSVEKRFPNVIDKQITKIDADDTFDACLCIQKYTLQRMRTGNDPTQSSKMQPSLIFHGLFWFCFVHDIDAFHHMIFVFTVMRCTKFPIAKLTANVLNTPKNVYKYWHAYIYEHITIAID